jgi:hypothetical protein
MESLFPYYPYTVNIAECPITSFSKYLIILGGIALVLMRLSTALYITIL